MADNTELNSGSGGDTIATDDISGVKHQRVKVQYGADGSATDVSDSNPLPVDDAGGSLTVDNGGTFAVQVDAALPAGTNAIGKLSANDGVDIGNVDVASCDGIAAEGAALGNGVLIQGDDGTDRKNINVDATTGDVQVDVTNTVTVDGSGVTQPVSGTVTANLSATDNTVLDNIDTNTTGLAGTVSGSELQVDVVASLPAGTNAIGKLAANSGVDIGDVDVTSVPNGSSHYRNVDANAEAAVKASAGTLYWIHVMNMTAAVAYLHLYDATTGNVTPGTTTPDFTFPIPTQGDTNGAGFMIPFPGGQAFANAITLVCTTTIDGSTGDPGTNGVFVNAGYA